MFGHILHLDGVAQIGLVGAVFLDRRIVGNARPVRVDGQAVGELLEHARDDGLHRREHVVLLDEAHLDVELVELAGQAVGTRILVAKAGCDLEVAVEARDHQQLLVLLRRLRQGVELARMHARRHQEIARAFRRRGGENGRRELVEARVVHAIADRARDRQPLHDDGVQRLAPQIEEAIGQADVFGVVGLTEHRQRQLLGFRQHLDLGGEQLHVARRQVGIHCAVGPVAHFTIDPDDPFRAHPLSRPKRRAVGIGDNLSDAVVIPHVDEQQPAVVAHPVHPARNAHGRARVSLAQRAAGMGAITVHRNLGHDEFLGARPRF